MDPTAVTQTAGTGRHPRSRVAPSSPWPNPKLVTGAAMVVGVLLLSLLGPLVVDTTLARAASSPLNLPPFWLPGGDARASARHREQRPRSPGAADRRRSDHAAGRPDRRRDEHADRHRLRLRRRLSRRGGRRGDPTISDTALTIPSLAMLIVVAAYVRQMDVNTMAFIVALFAWAGPTRLIRAQVLTMREQGYVRMARLSALSTPDIMFREMMPNLLPYLAASFIGRRLRRHPGRGRAWRRWASARSASRRWA